MTAVRPLAAVAAALVLTACGSSTRSASPGGPSEKVGATPLSAAPTGPASDPCALLSQQDATELKLKYPGQPGHADLGPSCDFGDVDLTVVDAKVSDSAFSYNSTQTVDGLGEKAYYGKDFHWLRVQTAHSRFEVRCVVCQQDTELERMSGIAHVVLTHVT